MTKLEHPEQNACSCEFPDKNKIFMIEKNEQYVMHTKHTQKIARKKASIDSQNPDWD